MEIIARLHAPFGEKFGVPRQSGLADTVSEVVFEPAYRNTDALRGLEGFSHLWLLWLFDKNAPKPWSPTVRPPRLGGNERMGVFATRSPFRPNSIGLSCVELQGIEYTEDGPVLRVVGADMVDGTAIVDIKPYLPYCDAHPEARAGWTDTVEKHLLTVHCAAELLMKIEMDHRAGLLDILAADPRPRYHDDPERIYGVTFAGKNVKFMVNGDELTVIGVE